MATALGILVSFLIALAVVIIAGKLALANLPILIVIWFVVLILRSIVRTLFK